MNTPGTRQSTEPPIALIPEPAHIRNGVGRFHLTRRTDVGGNSPGAVALLRVWLEDATGWTLPLARHGETAAIALRVSPEAPAGEGYRLEIRHDSVVVESATERGLGWGVQTLRQLFPPAIYSKVPVSGTGWTLPVVTIEDAPRLSWRGLMVDVARWYKPMEYLYRAVDLAALHKLNVVHLHLTDDQGWRFEVRRYPRLTEVGAWRRESRTGHWRTGIGDGHPHGGYYTQDELRTLVRYAAERGVTLLPEIDLPGHTQAAIAAYPELGNDPTRRLDVATGWGVIPHVLNVEETTVDFFCNVIDELVDVFPGEYVHIGGDECPTDEWFASIRAVRLMQERGLDDVRQLETWFVSRIVDHLHSRDRRAIGWDEIQEGGLPHGAAVMSWRGMFGGVEAAIAGHDVVMTPNTHTYFDQYQSADLLAEPVAADGVISLQEAYSFQPVPPSLPSDAASHILGAECALWAEHIPTVEHADYMLFPRMCAFAEAAWGTARDYGGFTARLRHHLTRLDTLGVGYHPMEPPTAIGRDPQ